MTAIYMVLQYESHKFHAAVGTALMNEPVA